ncbi:hypothetical protein N657DRAFT_663864 [Parathielavia appendiculata]|uniref:Uncharacterized protein n=1 Tax=Parathielavia appendiculata TaxID=2587402 RepID=A0AAN6U0H0_9PEZI|nr:hypothetical protein N657DRAFT_663864 [Parathielavia appendiculata]
MGAATLQPPKSGRSRFSKALPAPPSLPTFDFEPHLDLTPLAPEKAPSRMQPDAPLPPIPPPKGAAADRDIESAMAPIPKSLDSPLPPGPPPMSIPRRPVASPVIPGPGLAPATASVLASPEPLPSPVGSFSSLLSAYTAESPRWSSGNLAKGVVNSGGAYSVVSPNLDAQKSSAQFGVRAHDLPPVSSEQHGQNHQTGGQVPKTRHEDASRPQTPPNLQTQTAQPPTSTRQLWRRRSRSLTGDRILAVPDLKLTSSHGSTAASAQDTSQSSPNISMSHSFPAPAPTNPRDPEPAAKPRAPTRTANVGLPGRNIRPVVPGEQVAALDEKLANAKKRRGNAEEPKTTNQAAQVPPAASALISTHRLPTPEYGTNDVRSPVPEAILPDEPQPITRRPVGGSLAQIRPARSSPTLAPGPINTGLSVQTPAGLPSSPRPDVSQRPSETVFPAPEPNQRANQPQYRAYSPTPDRDRTPIQKQYIPYSPPPDRNAGPNLTQPPAQLPSRDEENYQQPLPAAPHQEHSSPAAPQPNQQQNLWPQPPTREPRPRTVSETGSIETVKPPPPPTAALPRQPPHPNPSIIEHLSLRQPDPNQPDLTTNPGALRFPRGWYKSTTNPSAHPQPQQDPDSIPDARPLTSRQYLCLTAHRYMTANRQRTNPVACRTCGHKDRFAECYICSACYLNVCAGCVGLLRRFKGDLGAVVREVEGFRKRKPEGLEMLGEEGGVVAELQG